MGQDDSNAEFEQLAFYLSSEFFLDHANKDVRLLTACCIADVFRIFAPEAPYNNPDHVKVIVIHVFRCKILFLICCADFVNIDITQNINIVAGNIFISDKTTQRFGGSRKPII